MKNMKKSPMEIYLRKNNMSLKNFAEVIGCSRQTIWKIKKGMAITTDLSYRIFSCTRGEVQPKCAERGRYKKEDKGS
jgi:biotin operon repressor